MTQAEISIKSVLLPTKIGSIFPLNLSPPWIKFYLFCKIIAEIPDRRNIWLTFHDVDQGAHVTLLDDAAVLAVLHRIHAVHDLLDLWLLQVLHKVIVLNGLLDEILGPGGKVKGMRCKMSDNIGIFILF